MDPSSTTKPGLSLQLCELQLAPYEKLGSISRRFRRPGSADTDWACSARSELNFFSCKVGFHF